MIRPTVLPNAPMGLEYLKPFDFILVDTAISSLVSKDKYVIKGEKGYAEFKIPNGKFICFKKGNKNQYSRYSV